MCKDEALFMSFQRSAIKEVVNDWALNAHNLLLTSFAFYTSPLDLEL